MKIFFTVLVLFMTVVSCTERVVQVAPIVNNVDIRGEHVDIMSSDATKYTRWIVGNYAISEDAMGKRCYYGGVIDNNKIGQFDTLFTVGHGHNEFDRIMLGNGQGNTLFLLNQPLCGNKLLSLTKIDASDRFADVQNKNNWEKYDLSRLPPFSCGTDEMVPLTDSTLLVLGAPYDAIGHIFSVIDYKNQKVLPLQYWPNDGIDCDSCVKHNVYVFGARLLSNGKDRFLYQCDREKYSFIFSIEGSKINIINELYGVYPDYKAAKDGHNFLQLNRTPENLYCTANAKNIYILFKEYDKDGNKKEKWDSPLVYGDIVNVYDWDGNILNSFHLDRIGMRIMVSEDNNKLYLFEDNYDENDLNIWLYDFAEQCEK